MIRFALILMACVVLGGRAAHAAEPAPSEALVARLLELADDPDPRVRFQAALTLGDVESPRRIEALAAVARRDCADRWVRTAILTAVNDDADNLLVDLMASEGVPPGGLDALIEGLGSVVGARARGPELAGVINAAAETGMDAEGRLAAAALRGLAAGLKLNEAADVSAPGADATLRRLAADPFSDEIRAAAAKLARSFSSPSAPSAPSDWSDLIYRLAPSRDDESRIAAIEGVREAVDPAPHRIIIGQFGGFTQPVREKALDVLLARRDRVGLLLDAVESGAIHPNKLDSARRAQLIKFPDPEIAARAARLLEGEPDRDAEALYEKYKPALDLRGDPAKGAATHKARCMQCHRAGGVGHDVGPNWASLRSNPPDKLLLNILRPSLNILPGFTQHVVELSNGRVAMGIIAASTPTSVTLRRGGGEEETLLRRNIRSMSDTALSIMPEGLEDGLTPQDMADLLAFIQNAD